MQISRRRILQLAGASALGGCLGGMTGVDAPDEDDPFECGVASGDPHADSVILWTRARPGASGAAVVLGWELARDESMTRIVTSGDAVATTARDHCVKVEARGLEADREYFFRFLGPDGPSPIGRTRTAPTAATALRFAVGSCSNRQSDRFFSYRHIAERDDLHAVLHLGDYIYEYEDEHGPIVNLDDYRRRHREYRRDPDLRAMHERHPFLPVWDDHEIANNVHRESNPARIEAATRAYFDYMPVRDNADRRIYRAMPYGGLAELIFLDTRLERDRQASGDEDPSLWSPTRRMIGPAQEEFLRERLERSPARWKVVCQQVMMAQRLYRDSVATDPWDGYPVQRERILEMFAASGGVAVLTGDIHSSWACELGFAPGDDDDPVAIELVAPALSSGGMTAEQAAGVYDRIAERCHHVRYAELRSRGYLAVELDEDAVRGTFHHIDDTSAAVGAVIASGREKPHLRRVG